MTIMIFQWPNHSALSLHKVSLIILYNSKLGLGCNLDKGLRKNKEDNQLVKHKDIELYLLLYIPIDYEK